MLFGVVPVIAALLLAMVTTPAQAAENPLSTTGARGLVNFYSGEVEVCDTRGDGRRAVALAVNVTQGRILGYPVDKNGANGCTPQKNTGYGADFDPFWHTPNRGDEIHLEVWIQDGANGAQEDLASTTLYY
ncbi:hypothetical protein A6A25_33485 [Saccharothrix sp. CB00851]|nr:hypothetical protein A6A25_33485 [Saccharothrix sp. CB00851]